MSVSASPLQEEIQNAPLPCAKLPGFVLAALNPTGWIVSNFTQLRCLLPKRHICFNTLANMQAARDGLRPPQHEERRVEKLSNAEMLAAFIHAVMG